MVTFEIEFLEKSFTPAESENIVSLLGQNSQQSAYNGLKHIPCVLSVGRESQPTSGLCSTYNKLIRNYLILKRNSTFNIMIACALENTRNQSTFLRMQVRFQNFTECNTCIVGYACSRYAISNTSSCIRAFGP